ncbi:MAG: hypothetical protein JST84_10645 [Acidobacteria bacterium]|nr:hypothetical protein [Acidobacteriota bacterium]
MAIITANSTCAICEDVFDPDKPLFATWGVFPVPAGLERYCDAPMHWDCYAGWPYRSVFAAAYAQMWIEIEQESAFWSKVWLNDKVLVTVNPDEPIAEVDVRLLLIGSCIRVKLADWEKWLREQPHRSDHPLEAEALAAVLPSLQANLPTAEVILNRIDYAARHARWEKRMQESEQRRAQEKARLLVYNQRCAAVADQSLVCPYCAETELRFTDGQDTRKSFFQCLACGRTFGPDNLQ